MNYKTTKRDFEIFEKECKKWIKYFGLTNWEFVFFHKDDETLGGCRAWYSGNYCGRVASIGLSLNWKNNKPTIHLIKKSAFHEVFEAMLIPLHVLARDRGWDKDTWETEAHTFIRMMENTVFEDSLKKK